MSMFGSDNNQIGKSEPEGRRIPKDEGAAEPILLQDREIASFRRLVYAYYHSFGRSLPWRVSPSPYEVLVSEVMLQQTQVSRVLGKYGAFLELFPDMCALAAAPTGLLLRAWQGLGYNRRAVSLKKCAAAILAKHGGVIPRDRRSLEELPGIGPATASAIMAFAFNQPVTFIETNIRTVYLYYFFLENSRVSDNILLALIGQTADDCQPRLWYYALMDYGAMLKKTLRNINEKSIHYVRQSRFEGSNRQLRGMAIRELLRHQCLHAEELAEMTGVSMVRTQEVLASLVREDLIQEKGQKFCIE